MHGKGIALVSVPIGNGFLFYQFVVKMSKLMKDSHERKRRQKAKHFDKQIKVNIAFDKDRLYMIYLNCIIGILSVSTSLISLLLIFINTHLFASLAFFDVVLNGYLMLLVYQFGHNLLPKCCTKRIWNCVQRQKEKINIESTDTSHNDTQTNIHTGHIV